MTKILFIAVGILMMGQTISADEPSKTGPAMPKCECINCGCTDESHCGCKTGKGCNCAPKSSCCGNAECGKEVKKP